MLLNIHIRYYTCDMVDSVFTEHHDLLAIFHFAIIVLIHTIYKRVIDKIFLHFGDIDHITLCKCLTKRMITA